MLELGVPHVTILRTAAGMAPMSMEHRRGSAAWLKANAEQAAKLCAGLGLVFESIGHRFVLSSILLLARVPTPYRVCATDEEALAWARELTGRPDLQRPR